MSSIESLGATAPEPTMITVIITTHNRPALVPRAIRSALDQACTNGDTQHPVTVEVIVIDDGSEPPVELDTDLGAHPSVSVVVQRNQGVSAARNAGLARATGAFITYLDDDDVLTSGALSRAVRAHQETTLPPPVGVLSALQEVTLDGTVIGVRLPPTVIAGVPFPLRELEPGQSHGSKQTLLVAPQVLRDLGGWDTRFDSRVTTELFMRLGVVCSLQGIDRPGYQLTVHHGDRLSADTARRQRSWSQLNHVHAETLSRHRHGAAGLALQHARIMWQHHNYRASVLAVIQATRFSPTRVLEGVATAVAQTVTRACNGRGSP